MEFVALLIFFLVYLGMMLGFWPSLVLDRTGIALFGAIAFIALQRAPVSQVVHYIDFPSIAILFSFMIISAQLYYSGFYTYVIDCMEKWKLTPSQLLLVLIGISALLINDIVCLAMTPLVIKVCIRKKLNPIPFLLGLACASNIGSAMTLVGNPQNLLIGQVLNIPFAQYLKFSFIPCLLGLIATWLIIQFQTKEWFFEKSEVNLNEIPFNAWQSCKGGIVVILLILGFIFTDIPQELLSLIAAGALLLSRRMASQTMLGFIDWQLLVLFIGLFIVNKSFLNMYDMHSFMTLLQSYHVNLQSPAWVAAISFFLSNLVSNVPAVMLLLPWIKTNFDGSVLALSSTLAGNLFIVGSIANIIVITQAAHYGVIINWKKHLKAGLPITCFTFLFTGLWLYLID